MAAMPTRPQAVFFCLLATTLFLPSSAQSCTSYTFSQNQIYDKCNSLLRLESSLHWNYHPGNGTVDVAYRATQSSDGWVAWGINPTQNRMVGTQALVAFQNTTSGNMAAYSTPISGYSPTMQPGDLSFAVSNVGGEYSGGVMTIFATLVLPNNRTQVNHVWQASTTFAGGFPGVHARTGDNVLSYGTIDFLSGDSAAAGNSRIRRKNRHGVLNAVSWGVLMPTGAIIARYLKVFKAADPAWFYLHVACQSSAYIVGVAGWGTGLKLGSESSGVKYNTHRNIGITLFALATLQVFALLLRPNKDHKYRIFWNVYHHSVGYAVISLSVANIYKGFDILDPAKKWKRAYTGVIIALGAVALTLEAVTWVIVLRRKSRGGGDKSHHAEANGATNGHGARQQVV
uniref:Cytochrome b561 and DOMON domain-containing protein n=1 Tax=Anthurium amnicola TaxID=1678845 RepID=A0A1D1ZIL4_9ARAE